MDQRGLERVGADEAVDRVAEAEHRYESGLPAQFTPALSARWRYGASEVEHLDPAAQDARDLGGARERRLGEQHLLALDRKVEPRGELVGERDEAAGPAESGERGEVERRRRPARLRHRHGERHDLALELVGGVGVDRGHDLLERRDQRAPVRPARLVALEQEAELATQKDVRASVGERLVAHQEPRAAGLDEPRLAALGILPDEDHPHPPLRFRELEQVGHHLLIARLEDVERQLGAREVHYARQREDR